MQQISLSNDSRTAALKKKYAPPRVMEYGNLQKLTQGGGGGAMDAVNMTKAA